MANARYGDVRLGFRVKVAGSEYFAIAIDQKVIQFVAEVESKELNGAMPDDITDVRWDKECATFTLNTGAVMSYEV